MAIFQAKNMAKMIHLISGSHIARRKAMMFVWGAPREDWPGNKILSGCFFNLTTFLKGLRGLTCCIIGNHIHIIDFSNNLSGQMLETIYWFALSVELKRSTFQVFHTIRPWRPAKWENDQAFTSKHWTSCKVCSIMPLLLRNLNKQLLFNRWNYVCECGWNFQTPSMIYVHN